MDHSQLGEIGQALIKILGERWPEFLDHRRVRDDRDLEIRYPSPHRADLKELLVLGDADLDEVIISFDGGHSHGGPWREPGDVDHGFAGSVRLIQAILDETVVGYELENGVRAIAELDGLRRSEEWGKVKHVASWRGTHDVLG